MEKRYREFKKHSQKKKAPTFLWMCLFHPKEHDKFCDRYRSNEENEKKNSIKFHG